MLDIKKDVKYFLGYVFCKMAYYERTMMRKVSKHNENN